MQAVVQPSTATARISVQGSEWTDPTTRVTFSRKDSFGNFAPLPGGRNLQALGGYAVYQDLEMPISAPGQVVTYRATNEHGQSITATVDSSSVEWGLWLKSRKAPELTTRLEWDGIGDQISDTQGEVYEVYGGAGIGQFGGIAPEAFTISGWVDGRIAYNRLHQLFRTDRQIFLQTGEPKEFEDGWVQVRTVAFPNEEGRLIERGSGIRYVRLDCVRIAEPVGAAKGGLGSPWRLAYTGWDTWGDMFDSGATWGSLLEVG